MSIQIPETGPHRRASAPGNPNFTNPPRPENGDGHGPAPGLEARERALEAECSRLEREVASLKAEQQHFLERYVGLEEQNATLTALYVACQRLHGHLNRSDVLLAVREIVANLVGCEEYVIFSLAADGWLHRVDSSGLESEAFEKLAPGTGLIGRAVKTGEIYLRPESDGSVATEEESNLTACIPLRRDGVVTGAFALFHLLPQKFEFQELDLELFGLFGTHLATALYCADLHESVRTRNGAIA